jgi:glutamine phosphoribosylpyrophosphate amidotransferase
VVNFSESIRHNCGIVVAHSLHDAYSFGRSLQHRGREAAGLAAIGHDRIDVIKWKGNVEKIDEMDLIHVLPSHKYHTYLFHVRYATRGRKDKILEDAHPHTIGGKTIDYKSHVLVLDCDMAIVHNGQVNDEFLTRIDNSILKTGCDTEALLHYYRMFGEHEIMRNIPGAYTLAIADKRREDVIVMRDRTGIGLVFLDGAATIKMWSCLKT